MVSARKIPHEELANNKNKSPFDLIAYFVTCYKVFVAIRQISQKKPEPKLCRKHQCSVPRNTAMTQGKKKKNNKLVSQWPNRTDSKQNVISPIMYRVQVLAVAEHKRLWDVHDHFSCILMTVDIALLSWKHLCLRTRTSGENISQILFFPLQILQICCLI